MDDKSGWEDGRVEGGVIGGPWRMILVRRDVECVEHQGRVLMILVFNGNRNTRHRYRKKTKRKET